MTTDQVHEAVMAPIAQCIVALDRQKPIGHGLTKAIRLPSGQIVQSFCDSSEKGAILVTITTDPAAPPADDPPSSRADDIALVKPLLDECFQSTRNLKGEMPMLFRHFTTRDGRVVIHDSCTRVPGGIDVTLDANRLKSAAATRATVSFRSDIAGVTAQPIPDDVAKCVRGSVDRSVSASEVFSACSSSVARYRKMLATATTERDKDEFANNVALFEVYEAASKVELQQRDQALHLMADAKAIWTHLSTDGYSSAIRNQSSRALDCFIVGNRATCASLFPRHGTTAEPYPN